MGIRRKSRETLLQLLFQAETNPDKDGERILTDFWNDFPPADPEIKVWVESRYGKIQNALKDLDEYIEKWSTNWKISRMDRIDRNVLRIAIYELIYDKLSGEIVIDEAVDIAKRFGSDLSGAFVNGILDAVYKSLEPD